MSCSNVTPDLYVRRARKGLRLLVVLTITLSGSNVAQAFAASSAQESATAPQQAPSALDRNSILRAVLWMRTSGEYEALCQQIFNAALAQIRQDLKTRQQGKPPAIIMDLDETVLDNGAYTVYLLTAGSRHSSDQWRSWNRNNIHKISLVPGAKEFIKAVEKENVHVAFISNRSESIRDITTDILVNHDLGRKQELLDRGTLRLLLREKTGSKEVRRREVRAKYDVIALLGDNLGDFSDDFRSPAVKSIDERRSAVKKHMDQWGARWFVLPNPIYGYWTRFIDWNQAHTHFESPRH
ncbi:MAG: 5'-nucleotidase, lipoprotein e(P4) family [Acidiferrobacterales bacterium]